MWACQAWHRRGWDAIVLPLSSPLCRDAGRAARRAPATTAAAQKNEYAMSKLRALSWLPCLLCLTASSIAQENDEVVPPEEQLPWFDAFGDDYKTPRSGVGFRTELFGEPVTVTPRNRRAVYAWGFGASLAFPTVDNSEFLPYGALYFWRHPDENSLLRAVVAGLVNNVTYAHSYPEWGGWEGSLHFDSVTLPIVQTESIDGRAVEEEGLIWGRAHLGFGIGWRKQLEEPKFDDNMFEATWVVAEPGFLYFHDTGDDAVDNFEKPANTFEIRSRLRLRIDKMERNLLGLPHAGYVAGVDGVIAHRFNWEDWGKNGEEDASDGRNWAQAAGYFMWAGGVPGVKSERHRVLFTLQAGVGWNNDRFSKFRIGGGPTGEDYESIGRTILPGALIEEFNTDRYGMMIAEYRYEPVFFAYFTARAAVGYVRRPRFDATGLTQSDDFLTAVGGRITSGFIFETRLQLEYSYNFDVIREDDYGGHEVTFYIAGEF